MCMGIPMQVVEAGELMAVCEGRNGRVEINVMLVGYQEAGTWLMTFLGSAREVISEEDAWKTDQALNALEAVMAGGEDVDIDAYFPDLVANSQASKKLSS